MRKASRLPDSSLAATAMSASVSAVSDAFSAAATAAAASPPPPLILLPSLLLPPPRDGDLPVARTAAALAAAAVAAAFSHSSSTPMSRQLAGCRSSWVANCMKRLRHCASASAAASCTLRRCSSASTASSCRTQPDTRKAA